MPWPRALAACPGREITVNHETVELTDDIAQDEPVAYLVFCHQSCPTCEYRVYAAERAHENAELWQEGDFGGPDWPVYPLYASHPMAATDRTTYRDAVKPLISSVPLGRIGRCGGIGSLKVTEIAIKSRKVGEGDWQYLCPKCERWIRCDRNDYLANHNRTAR